MNRWTWVESSLLSGETICSSFEGIRLYDGSKRTDYDNGHLTLTNFRLLWKTSKSSLSLGLDLSCLVYFEEESGGFLGTPKVVLHLTQTTAPTSNETSFMKLGFKQGKMSVFQDSLAKVVEQKSWRKSSLPKASTEAVTSSKSRAGILGIERAIEAKHKKQDQNISVAFEDLKNLMSLAKTMVTLSKHISEKIRDKTGELSSDETVQLRSYLLGLGIDDPVTKDAIGSTTEYHTQLAQEISKALHTPVKEAGGVMLLTEVYCRINRARGLHLLSPDDVYNACTLMSSLQLPLVFHTYTSGVQVLQLSSLDEQKILRSVEVTLKEHTKTGLSYCEFAHTCGISLILAQERLHSAELSGCALLDQSSQGFRFYPNLFAVPALE